MNHPDELARQNEILRERLTRLSQASLRINESLDFDTVLQLVLDSARSLTNSRYGVLTLHDLSGQVQNFLSSGMSDDESSHIWDLQTDPPIYEYLGSITEPLRVPDMLGHIREMGLPELRLPSTMGPVVSMLASPIRYQDQRVGNIYVSEKQGQAVFSQEDEDMLVMFASQAAMVIANARRYREEQRARRDLEILVNTSPVGVVVFDARSGALLSYNRESMRIAEFLRNPDQPLEQLLDVLTCVRADGRIFSPNDTTILESLGANETVRAEEVVLSVPDGRKVTALVNATPIVSEDGLVETYVVTLQDMSPIQELELLRAEFLGMVSHELRTPLATIKGSTTSLLGSFDDMDPAVTAQFHRIIDQQVDHMEELIGNLLDVARIQSGTLAIEPVTVEVGEIVDEARNKFLGAAAAGRLQLDLSPDLPPVKADRRRISQVLGNLLSNAFRSSPQALPVLVKVEFKGVHVEFAVSDQGKGIAEDVLPDLFRRFSRIDASSGSGATRVGLGLAICKGIVEAHGGRIFAESGGPGQGSCFRFTIPAADRERVIAPDLASDLPYSVTSDKLRILAVDDDPQALRYIRDAIVKAGFMPIVTGDPEDVPRLMSQEKPHLVLLDLMLPGSDGIELMNDILRTQDLPIIFVSVYGQEDVVARAFDMGASDYVVKPFSPTELAARIRAALRRRALPDVADPTEPYQFGGLAIDYAKRLIEVEERQIELTPTEYGLLYELSIHAGRALTHDHLLSRVWGREKKGEPWLVREVVKRLRRKLGDDAANPTYILTEPRVGYRMAESQNTE